MNTTNFAGRSAFGSRKQRGAYLVLAAAAGATINQSQAQAQFNPIVLNSSSFNAAVIVNKSAPLNGAGNYINATMDGGTGNLQTNVWFERGYTGSTAGLGIPTANSTFTSIATGTAHIFQMPSSYASGGTPATTTNDAMFLGYTNGSTLTTATGTMTFVSPASFSSLSFLAATGGGANGFSVVANYANGTHATLSAISIPDWYTGGTNTAVNVGQRVTTNLSSASTFNGNGAGSTPDLYQVDVTGITDTTDPIASVTLTNTSGTGRTSIFAISGVYTPVALTYTGAVSAVFDNTTPNFNNSSGTATTFTNYAGVVTFPDLPASATDLTISNVYSPGGLIFANNVSSYQFDGTGSFNGAGVVTVNNGGSVIFNQSNGYIGTTNVSSGTITTTSVGSIGTGPLIIGAVATGTSTSLVTLNNASPSISSLSGNGALVFNGTGALNIGGGGVFSGTINGTGNIIFNGSMTYNTSANDYLALNGLTGANGSTPPISAYTGTTFFNSGSITIFSPYSFGTGSTPLVFNGGGLTAGTAYLTSSAVAPATSTGIVVGALQNPYNISSGSTLTLSGTNPLELAGPGFLLSTSSTTGVTVSVATATNTLTLSGPLSSYNTAGTLVSNQTVLTKAGAGILVLSNSTNNLGLVNVSAGTLNFVTGSLGSGNEIYLGGGTLQYAAGTASPEDVTTTHTLVAGATNTNIDTNGNTVTFAGPIVAASTTAGQLNKVGGGTLILTGASTLFDFVASGGSSNAASPVVSTVTITGPTASLTVLAPGNGFGIGFVSGDNVVVNIANGASVNAGNVSAGGGYGGLNIADQAGTANDPDLGTLNISGPTTTVFASAVLVAKGYASSTSAANSIGVLNMSGGTLTCLNNAGTPGSVFTVGGNAAQGGDGTGLVLQTGGTINARPGVTITGNTGSIGTYNLAGGTLNTPNIVSGSGTSTFLFNGGMLNYTGTATTSFTLVTNTLNVAQIQAGGLNLNQSSYPVTIAANLSSNGSAASPDGGMNLVGTGAVTLSGNDLYYGPTNISGGLIFAQSGTTNLSGAISGSGYVNQSGSGITYLSGNNTYTGGTNITSGIVVALSPTAFGATTTNVTFSGTGTIGLPNDSAGAVFSSGYTFNKEAISFLNYTSSLTFTNVTNLTLGAAAGTPSTLTGSINGATSLTYVGPNTLYLTNPSSNFSGGTNLAQGTLNFVAGALGTGPITLNGGILQYAPGNTQDVSTTPGLILGTGGGVDVGTNTVTFASSITNYPAANVNTGAFTAYGSNGGTLNLTGSLYPTSFFARASNVTLVGSGALISATAYSDVAVSAGDSVVFTMDNGATFTSTSDFNVADTSAAGTTTTTGTFNINTTTATGTSLTAGNIYVGKGTSGNTNAIGVVNQTGGTVAVKSTSSNFQVGVYGTGTYNQYGGNVTAGTVKLGVNTGSIGVYNLSGGTLTASSITGGSGTSSLYLNGGTIAANASGTLISGLTSAKLGPVPTTINTNGYGVTISQAFNSGVVAGTDGGLIKTGSGTLTMGAAGNYSGGTVVTAGTLVFGATSALGTGPVTLGGATLSFGTPTATSTFSSLNLQLNHDASWTSFTPTLNSGLLTLTNGGYNQATSAFGQNPVAFSDLGTFTATFTLNHSSGADGISFMVQGSGPTAVGGNGSALGLGEDPSLNYVKNGIGAVVDVYHNLIGISAKTQTDGSGAAPNYYSSTGATDANGSTTGTVALGNLSPSSTNNPDTVTVIYNGPTKTMTETLTSVNSVSTTATVVVTNIDLATILGAAAGGPATGYVGFTGATGGIASTNNVSNFALTSFTPGSNLSNPIVTTASTSSTIIEAIATGSTAYTFGTLNLGAGSTLTVSPNGSAGATGYTYTFGATTLTGSSTLNLTNTSTGAAGTVVLGALNDNAVPATLTVGSGTVILSAPATSFVTGSAINVPTGAQLGISAKGTLGAGGIINNAGLVALAPGLGTVPLAFGTATGNIALNGDTLSLSPATPVTISGVISDGSAAGGLTVASGLVVLTNTDTYTGLTTVLAGATLNTSSTGIAGFGSLNVSGTARFANPDTGVISYRTKNAITVNAGGLVTFQTAANHSSRTLVSANTLSIDPAGSFNLSNNDLDLNGSSSSLATITQYVANGYNLVGGANWSGLGGIRSSAAAADTTYTTALGVIQNNQGGTPLFYAASGTTPGNLFDGIAPGASDILVKYTYFGDANLDGKVDGSDYSLIDNGYTTDLTTPGALTGWYNGDFNYDGVIDGSDYALIDNAFNNQGATLTTPTVLVATDTAQVAGPASAVPEPASMALIGVATMGLAARRRRR